MKLSPQIILAQVLFTLFMYGMGVLVLGLAIFPGVAFLYHIWVSTPGVAIGLRLLYFCFGFVIGYFVSGAVLMILVSLIRVAFNLQLKEGEFGLGSIEIFKWVFVNALFLVVKVIFMDFILLTPYCSIFYRLMGAKIGHNVMINSKNVADLSLLEIGDSTVIGGNATVICHSFEQKGLKLKKVSIGNNVIIGLNSVILPGVEIGERAVVAAGAIVPKGTKIGPGSVYLGVRE